MSNPANEAFLMRVAEFIDETQGMSYIPEFAEKLLNEQNYEALEWFMNDVESSFSESHFHNYNLLPEVY